MDIATMLNLAVATIFALAIDTTATIHYTIAIETALLVILNICFIMGQTKFQEKINSILEEFGLGLKSSPGIQIIFIEVLCILHLLLFLFLNAIANEYYCMARDDPKMND